MIQVPLKILITDSSILSNDVVAEQVGKLEKAGHSVVIDEQLKGYDFITGPNCWLLRPEVAGLFTMAVTNARKIANADQQRVEQKKAASASKRATKANGTAGKRGRKVKGASQGEGPQPADPVANTSGSTESVPVIDLNDPSSFVVTLE